MFYIYAFVINCVLRNVVCQETTAPYDIRVDHYKVDVTKDLVINTARPQISWKISAFNDDRNVYQTAYQLQIQSRKTQWDSGQIISKQSLHVFYTNLDELHSTTFYQLRLRIWTTLSNESSAWTEWIRFRTFMFDIQTTIANRASEFMWIGSNMIPRNEFRKEFQVPGGSPIQSAVVFISGLGYYELYVNGNKTDSSRKLDPAWTVYEKRTLLVSFDLSAIIKVGMNAVGVRLGNGWYSREQNTFPMPPSQLLYGPPRFLFYLKIFFEDGSEFDLGSDTTWIGRQNAILHDSIYNGEFVDSRYDRTNWSQVGFNDTLSLWLPADEMPSPLNKTLPGHLVMQDMPPIRAGADALHIEVSTEPIGEYLTPSEVGQILGGKLSDGGVLKPIATWSPTIGVQVFDMGQNMAGWCRIKLRGPRGVGIYIHHGEVLTLPTVTAKQASGEVYTENLLGATQSDTYVLRGDPTGEIYEPTFTYHGFRYVSIYNVQGEMALGDVECPVVHSETTLKGHFTTSNPIINQIQHNIQWSQLNNLMSLPTDCPQRQERRGWLGDAALTVNEALYNFDLIKLYINFLHSIVDSQGPDGSVPDTVPFADGDYPADPNWGSAFPTIAWQLYRHYNDPEVLYTFYTNIRTYVESVHTAYKSTGLAGLFYSYSDWVPPPPEPRVNGSLASSFAFLHDVSLLVNISQVIHNTNDTAAYLALYQRLAEEFHQVFFNRTSNFYGDGSQTAQIFALALPNVVPNNVRHFVLDRLVSDINQKDIHVSTGILGTAFLYPLLSDNGHHDLALRLITSTTYPSYGYMFNNPYENATTLWELWNTPFEGPQMNSRDHIMFGSVGAWFYSHLAGIDFDTDSIVIHPRLATESNKHLLSKVDCQLNTRHGLIHVAYTRDTTPNSIRLRLHIPPNTRARVIFEPLFSEARCSRIIEGNELIWLTDRNSTFNKQNLELELKTGSMIAWIGSGKYEYEVYWE
ncbi:unnamed protein product [Adineta ricciae]|uniref:alpha-L-rhamnosidase n=1 Tax=Adineta ricciae TaxID=249248 RepID=A0A814NEV4_ADIRI|nr:unnamed protein product [Adineta ricciae]CAF1412508.1 unnamed protein product [Adineta ricciae]